MVASCIKFGFTTLEEVENIVNSIEFKKYPELFTSQTLAHGNIKEIQEMINSQEFKEHPELFTSRTFAASWWIPIGITTAVTFSTSLTARS